MGREELAMLGIDAVQAARAVDFFEAYGALCEGEVEQYLPMAADNREAVWMAATDGASALREAAQWAVAAESGRAPALLRRSAMLYLRSNQPYGLFLSAACQAWPSNDPLPLADEWLMLQLRGAIGVAATRAEERGTAGLVELEYPQQQMYALLAAASSPDFFDRGTVEELAQVSALSQSPAPIGALGAPISIYAQTAIALAAGDAYTVLESLTVLSDQYAASVRAARENHYLWVNAAAPMDVVDADILALCLIMAARFGTDVFDELIGSRSGLSDLARLPIHLSLAALNDGRGEALR